MKHVHLTYRDDVAIGALSRGKVNALTTDVIHDLGHCLDALEMHEEVRALVLTGAGSFFSFGFDVPELYPWPKADFAQFLEGFTELCRRLFTFPKPIVASINGHAIAAGCMLAIACDRRVMATGKAKISLNEITFGASVFAGSVEMLRHCAGDRSAEAVLLSGKMYGADDALAIGLVDRTATPEQLAQAAMEEAHALAVTDSTAFRSMKNLLRGPAARRIEQAESESIREFVEIWYSEGTREKLRAIEIRG